MSAGTSGVGVGEEYRSGKYVPAGILALIWLGGSSAWLLRGWLQRRFGLEGEVALVVAAAPGVLAGVLVLRAVLKGRPRMDPAQRRRLAVAACSGMRVAARGDSGWR